MNTSSNKDQESGPEAPLSSYALMTAERLLLLLGIRFNRNMITRAMRNNKGLYEKLLSAPLKNVLNGIVLQQVTDYQVYLQKLFVDYLMSGVTTLSEESPGAGTRQNIEEHREYTLALGTRFQELELTHLNLIGDTQKELISLTKTISASFDSLSRQMMQLMHKKGLVCDVNAIQQVIHLSVVDLDMTHADATSHLLDVIAKQLQQSLTELERQSLLKTLSLEDDFKRIASAMDVCCDNAVQSNIALQNIRNEFFDAIVEMQKLLGLLSGNQLQETHSPANLELIQFDRNIG